MDRLRREPWRYDLSWGTVIALAGCSFGLEVDGRCHSLYCKFRCDREKEPSSPVRIGLLLCPREVEYEARQPNEAYPRVESDLVSP